MNQMGCVGKLFFAHEGTKARGWTPDQVRGDVLEGWGKLDFDQVSLALAFVAKGLVVRCPENPVLFVHIPFRPSVERD